MRLLPVAIPPRSHAPRTRYAAARPDDQSSHHPCRARLHALALIPLTHYEGVLHPLTQVVVCIAPHRTRHARSRSGQVSGRPGKPIRRLPAQAPHDRPGEVMVSRHGVAGGCLVLARTLRHLPPMKEVIPNGSIGFCDLAV